MRQEIPRPRVEGILKVGLRLVALLALLAGLCGCRSLTVLPYAREIDDVALMRTMGVDTAPEGVSVTVSSGVQKGEEEAEVVNGRSGTISGALLDMQAEGASYLFYGHMSQLLLGEDMAAQGVEPTLDYVLRDIEMRLDTVLYLVRGARAGSVLETCAQGGDSAADRLDAMKDDAGLVSHSAPRTVGEVLGDLAATGSSFAPALELGEEGRLTAVGYGILKDGALADWAIDETAKGINLLLSRVDADVVERAGTALRVVGARTQVRPVFQGDELIGLHILCKIDANVAEEPAGSNLADPDQRAALEEALGQAEGARIQAAMALLCRLDADALDLENRACLATPWREEEIRRQWDLPDLELQIEVEANILRGYDVDR